MRLLLTGLAHSATLRASNWKSSHKAPSRRSLARSSMTTRAREPARMRPLSSTLSRRWRLPRARDGLRQEILHAVLLRPTCTAARRSSWCTTQTRGCRRRPRTAPARWPIHHCPASLALTLPGPPQAPPPPRGWAPPPLPPSNLQRGKCSPIRFVVILLGWQFDCLWELTWQVCSLNSQCNVACYLIILESWKATHHMRLWLARRRLFGSKAVTCTVYLVSFLKVLRFWT
jgi:hypothetical protein